jgi:hypothetical protein
MLARGMLIKHANAKTRLNEGNMERTSIGKRASISGLPARYLVSSCRYLSIATMVA